VTSTSDGMSTPIILISLHSSLMLILEEDGQQLEYHLIEEWYVLCESGNNLKMAHLKIV